MAHAIIHPFRIDHDPNGPSISTMLDDTGARGFAVYQDFGNVAPYFAQWLFKTRAEAQDLADRIKAGERPAITRDWPAWLNEPRGTIYLP